MQSITLFHLYARHPLQLFHDVGIGRAGRKVEDYPGFAPTLQTQLLSRPFSPESDGEVNASFLDRHPIRQILLVLNDCIQAAPYMILR